MRVGVCVGVGPYVCVEVPYDTELRLHINYRRSKIMRWVLT